jgi:hypothetical protein
VTIADIYISIDFRGTHGVAVDLPGIIALHFNRGNRSPFLRPPLMKHA